MAETLAELAVKITTDTAELRSGLDKADKGMQDFVKNNEKALKTIGIAMTAFGVSVTGLLTVAVKSFAGFGTELKELSQKTGISVESLSELKYAGKMAGVSLDTLAIAIRSMANFMETASSGSKEATATLKKLRLSVSDLEGLSPEQTFMKLSSAVAAIPDPMRRSALAVDVFGRSGTQLLPMLAEGTDGIAKLRQKAQELGITMSTETAEGADALGDALDTVKSSMGGVFNAIGNSLAPMITDLAGRISNLLSGVIGWSKAHPELSKNILLVAGGLGILSLTIGPIIIMLPQIITQIAALKVAFLTLNTAIGPIGWAIAGISAALVLALPWILSATSATKDLTNSMSDLEKQTFRLNVQQEFTAEKWDDITKKGYLTEEEFGKLARAMGLTTQALYDQLLAANMLETVWKSETDRNIYIKNLDEIKIGLDQATGAQDALSDAIQGTKQAIGSATWTADGYTYSMQLFTQAEIDAAIASGKKVDVLKSQSDVTADNIDKTKDYITTIDDASTSVDELIKKIKEWPSVPARLPGAIDLVEAGVISAAGEFIGVPRSAAFLRAEQKRMLAEQGETTAEIVAEYGKAIARESEALVKLYPQLSWHQAAAVISGQAELVGGVPIVTEPGPHVGGRGEVVPYQHGGIITQPTLGLIGEAGPEAVIPLNEAIGGITINFTQPVFFDREDTMNKFVDMIRKGIQRQDRLRFGGAYSG